MRTKTANSPHLTTIAVVAYNASGYVSAREVPSYGDLHLSPAAPRYERFDDGNDYDALALAPPQNRNGGCEPLFLFLLPFF
jgi:hypothetical protein